MINSLRIGNLTLPNNIIQGPLAGHSCAPFRALTEEFSQPGFCVTEMLSAKKLVHGGRERLRFIYKDPDEGLLSFQLSGNTPEDLGQATQMVTQLGADLVDLNCGCPMPKIRKKGTGSRLLEDPQKLYILVKAMRDNTTIPVTVKIRIDNHPTRQQHILAAKAAQDAGADALIVHGRHWTEDYETPCQHDKIREVVDALSIPVIGNGDLESHEDIHTMYKNTGCAGFMVARAGLGQPWLISEMKTGERQSIPLDLQKTSYLRHVQGLIDLENETLALLQARKLAKYYFRQLEKDNPFFTQIHACESYGQLVNTVLHSLTIF